MNSCQVLLTCLFSSLQLRELDIHHQDINKWLSEQQQQVHLLDSQTEAEDMVKSAQVPDLVGGSSSSCFHRGTILHHQDESYTSNSHISVSPDHNELQI